MNDHRTPLKPSRNEILHSIRHLNTNHNLPTTTSHKNFPLTNRPLSRRVVPSSSPILIEENISETKNLPQGLVSGPKVYQGPQKFSKNFRDVKKSLANLDRAPGNSGSGDEVMGQQRQGSPRRTICDLTLANLQLQNFPNIDSRVLKATQGPAMKTTMTRDNRYGREVASIAEFKYGQKELSQQDYGDVNVMVRNLRTEGDAPVERREKSRGNSSEAVEGKNMRRDSMGVGAQKAPIYVNRNKPEEKRKSSSSRKKLNIGTKELGNNNRRNSGRILTSNNISDDVKYGEGGVGYSAGGKREKMQEGEPLVWGNEKRGSTAQNSGDKKVICVERETMSRWKHDISEIKRDIEKRKKSYEKVEKFITNIQHETQPGDRNTQETLPSFAVYSHHSQIFTSSQATGPTLATIPTQPAQPNFERIVSPSFSSAVNFPLVSQHTPLFGPALSNEQSLLNAVSAGQNPKQRSAWNEVSEWDQERNGKEHIKAGPLLQIDDNNYLLENERERALCKVSCCGTNPGCQMF